MGNYNGAVEFTCERIPAPILGHNETVGSGKAFREALEKLPKGHYFGLDHTDNCLLRKTKKGWSRLCNAYNGGYDATYQEIRSIKPMNLIGCRINDISHAPALTERSKVKEVMEQVYNHIILSKGDEERDITLRTPITGPRSPWIKKFLETKRKYHIVRWEDGKYFGNKMEDGKPLLLSHISDAKNPFKSTWGLSIKNEEGAAENVWVKPDYCVYLTAVSGEQDVRLSYCREGWNISLERCSNNITGLEFDEPNLKLILEKVVAMPPSWSWRHEERILKHFS